MSPRCGPMARDPCYPARIDLVISVLLVNLITPHRSTFCCYGNQFRPPYIVFFCVWCPTPPTPPPPPPPPPPLGMSPPPHPPHLLRPLFPHRTVGHCTHEGYATLLAQPFPSGPPFLSSRRSGETHPHRPPPLSPHHRFTTRCNASPPGPLDTPVFCWPPLLVVVCLSSPTSPTPTRPPDRPCLPSLFSFVYALWVPSYGLQFSTCKWGGGPPPFWFVITTMSGIAGKLIFLFIPLFFCVAESSISFLPPISVISLPPPFGTFFFSCHTTCDPSARFNPHGSHVCIFPPLLHFFDTLG